MEINITTNYFYEFSYKNFKTVCPKQVGKYFRVFGNDRGKILHVVVKPNKELSYRLYKGVRVLVDIKRKQKGYD